MAIIQNLLFLYKKKGGNYIKVLLQGRKSLKKYCTKRKLPGEYCY